MEIYHYVISGLKSLGNLIKETASLKELTGRHSKMFEDKVSRDWKDGLIADSSG